MSNQNITQIISETSLEDFFLFCVEMVRNERFFQCHFFILKIFQDPLQSKFQTLYFEFHCNRDIRKKGRNKLHALRCRQRQREEVRLLQERVQRETETRRRLMETHEQVGTRGTRDIQRCDTCHVTEEEGAGDLHQAAGPGAVGDWALPLLNTDQCTVHHQHPSRCRYIQVP